MDLPSRDETDVEERVLVAFEPALFARRGDEVLKAEVQRLLRCGEVAEPTFVQLPFVAIAGAAADEVRAALAGLRGVAAVTRTRPYALLIVLGFETALRTRAAVEGAAELGAPDLLLQLDGRPPSARAAAGPVVVRSGRFHAINLSLGTDEIAPYDPHDPVNLATKVVARSVAVVAAAGNEGYVSSGVETLNAWAQAPWVISVAATTASDGGTRARYSSVGDKRRRSTHPTVAAYGASALDETMRGTSFAAPRVARQLAFLGSFIETLRSTASVFGGGVAEAPPVPWTYLVDCRVTRRFEPERPLRALPRGAVDPDALQRASQLLEAAEVGLDLEPTPRRLRSMLIRSARPVPGCSRRLVGAGFVSDETSTAYLERFSGLELARVFVGERVGLPPALLAELASLPLTIADEVAPLRAYWEGAQVVASFDVGECEGELGLHRAETAARG